MCLPVIMGNLHSLSQLTHIKELTFLLSLPESRQSTFRAWQVPSNITHVNQFLITDLLNSCLLPASNPRFY